MYYIYLLSDNGVPFYIGVTQNLKNRLSEHKTTYGPTIVIEKIDEHEGSLTTAMALEQLWIRKYQDKGIVLKNKEPKNIGVSETICMHCGAITMQYSGKREKKFCSTSCRVMYNRKHGKKKEVTPLQMQVLYNSMLELVDKMGTGPLQVERIPPLSKKEETAMFNYEHKDQLTTITEIPSGHVKTMEEYILEKRELPDEEAYRIWLKELETDPNLTDRQKKQAKSS